MRYSIREGSESGHCCFKATVVDTSKPYMIGKEHYPDCYVEVCECFNIEDAEKICAALNAANDLKEI